MAFDFNAGGSTSGGVPSVPAVPTGSGTPAPSSNGFKWDGAPTAQANPLDSFSSMATKPVAPVPNAGQNYMDQVNQGISTIQSRQPQYNTAPSFDPAHPWASLSGLGKTVASDVGKTVKTAAGAVIGTGQALFAPITALTKSAADATGVHPIDSFMGTKLGDAINNSKNSALPFGQGHSIPDVQTDSPAMQTTIGEHLDEWSKMHPDAASNLSDILNLGMLALGAKGLDMTIPGAGAASSAVKGMAGDLSAVTDKAKGFTGPSAAERSTAADLLSTGNTTDAQTAKFAISDPVVQKAVEDIKSSDSTKIFNDAIKEGALKKEQVYAHDDVLTPQAAEGQINDVAQKLDKVQPGLGDTFRTNVDGKELTMKNIVQEGQGVLSKVVNESLAKDPIAAEAMKQGIEPGDVALAKSMSAADKAKASEMIDVAEKAKTDKLYSAQNRPSDIAGRTFVEQASYLKKVNSEAVSKLNDVAKTLKGQTVDVSPAYESFLKDLEGRGVTVDPKGKLDFKDSDFDSASMKGSQTTLQEFFDRAQKLNESGDAYAAHQAKRAIDEVVGYGRQSKEGLAGGVERIAKNFRRNVDGILDKNFPEYNKVNTTIAETIKPLTDVEDLLGKKTSITDELAPEKAGTLMRRIASNAGSRVDIMRVLSNIEEVAKQHGMKIDESVLKQALWADTIEKQLGGAPQNSFLGQSQMAVENALDGAALVKEPVGSITKLVGKYGGAAVDKVRGISPEMKIAALKKILGK